MFYKKNQKKKKTSTDHPTHLPIASIIRVQPPELGADFDLKSKDGSITSVCECSMFMGILLLILSLWNDKLHADNFALYDI